jgi:hypothetical protein
MQSDFLDAHARHWDDAESLYLSERWANADHLYGIAAECGLKRLMMRFGMEVDEETGRPTDSKDRKHVNGAWERFESYRRGKEEGTRYVLPSNPFCAWDVSDRYAHQSNFDRSRAQSHQAGARIVRELIKKAQLEGLI